jgi:hypothetical protein
MQSNKLFHLFVEREGRNLSLRQGEQIPGKRLMTISFDNVDSMLKHVIVKRYANQIDGFRKKNMPDVNYHSTSEVSERSERT